MIKILQADDQSLVRGALAALLDLETDIEVVAQVGRGDEVVAAARESGAEVCLLDIEMPGATGLGASALLKAERRMHQGLRVIGPDLAAEALMAGSSPLTAREAEVLGLALDGSPVAAIAARAHLSPGTVRNHLSAAIGTTGATTRTEAARLAQANGWL